MTDNVSGKRELFISFQGVTLRAYDRIVFPKTDWVFYAHQHWALYGANGSGKSILAGAIYGQFPVVEGRIVHHFLEKSAAGPASTPNKRAQDLIARVGFEQQKAILKRQTQFYQARWHSSESAASQSVSDYLLSQHVKRIDNIRTDDRATNVDKFLAKQADIADLLSIEPLLEKKIVQLSNGEIRKVGLARALLTGPRLLILENPLTGLDTRFRERMKVVIDRLIAQDIRILVVTSRRDEILPGITHVLAVKDKTIVEQGVREKILNSSAVRFEEKRFRPIRVDESVAKPIKTNRHRGQGDVLVRMKNVNITYHRVKVLQHIDWTIKRKENWAVLGPNGSGKTTLLSLILGDNPQAYANDIVLFGRRKGTGESIWEIKERIGFISPELHVHYPYRFSAFDVICSGFFDSIGLYRKCSDKMKDAARSWLKQLGMSSYAETRFGTLSDGIQRMILVARALVKNPQLLVLDEPCQGLDERNRRQIFGLVEAVGRRMDTGIIYVTHDIDELPDIITHLLRLEDGKVVEVMTRPGKHTV
ncbi:MAG: ATP-binding cassette domain-containing protein [Desulfobacterales bacterium]|nr:ATP-binding cassette domain-containing protein [Desulfobacterales bacterium]